MAATALFRATELFIIALKAAVLLSLLEPWHDTQTSANEMKLLSQTEQKNMWKAAVQLALLCPPVLSRGNVALKDIQ